MKVKPYKEEIIQLVIDYLSQQLNETSIATALQNKYLPEGLPEPFS